MTLDREELSWAAGLFDGEGSTSTTKASRWRLQIPQGHREVLDRFQKAVGGLGHIFGPYPPAPGRKLPRYQWAAQSFEEAQAVLAMLWFKLGTVKRAQAKAVMLVARSR